MEAYLQALLNNQIVTGLSFTALLGAVAFQLRRLPLGLYHLALRAFTVKLDVDSRDPVFLWIDKWLSVQPYAKRTHMVTLRSEANVLASPEEQAEQKWILSPGYGMHWFLWSGRLIVVNRGFEEAKVDSKRPIEKVEFRTLGRSQDILRRLVNEAYELVAQKNLVTIRVWRDWWAPIPGKAPRPLDTLVLQQGQMERLLADIQWFTGAKDWYIERGIPYRRGYLFTGSPGTGKTSVVLALAGYLKRPVCVLNIGSIKDDNGLFSAIADAPVNAMILIEDIDCAQPAKTRSDASHPDGPSEEGSGVTKAGLLNALDGVTTPDGRIVVMTTNYHDRLDEALIRPGRADVHEHFECLDAEAQIRMARRFYGDVPFIPSSQPVSPAAMQAAFMRHPDDYARAMALIEDVRRAA